MGIFRNLGSKPFNPKHILALVTRCGAEAGYVLVLATIWPGSSTHGHGLGSLWPCEQSRMEFFKMLKHFVLEMLQNEAPTQ